MVTPPLRNYNHDHNIGRTLDTLIPLPPCVNVGLVAADTQPNNSQSLNIDSGGRGALAHQDVFTYLHWESLNIDSGGRGLLLTRMFSLIYFS